MSRRQPRLSRTGIRTHWLLLGAAALLPLLDVLLPASLRVSDLMRPIFIFAVMGLGLNIIVGYTGLLNLGIAAFMAIGVYTYSIATCDIYPFRAGFWWGCAASLVAGGLAGALLGLPTLRLRGDYLAIVTLGFGEIVQDLLRNMESITKGQQGINPLPLPSLPGIVFTPDSDMPWYYLLLAILAVVVVLCRNLESSRLGRAWISIREDELAAQSMGINPIRAKLSAFALGASLCALAGALWASYLGSSGEPSNYDFQVSIITLCIVIVGGMGNISGVLVGSLLMIGLNSIVLARVSELLAARGLINSQQVFSSPNNWKYMIFGLALLLTMRFKPEGLLPSGQVKAELHHEPPAG